MSRRPLPAASASSTNAGPRIRHPPAEFSYGWGWSSDPGRNWIADGSIDAAALHTGTVDLAGVAAAFDALAEPERHAKILIDPTHDEGEEIALLAQFNV